MKSTPNGVEVRNTLQGECVVIEVVSNDLPDPTKCTTCGAPRGPHMCI